MERTVKLGLMAYVDENGIHQWGFAGEKIRVHPENVERFDSLNVLPGEQPEPEPSPVTPEPVVVEHVLAKPAGNASLEEWQAFAQAEGEDIEGLTRNEIRALFA